jgi:toxin ParE1/3/4
MPVAFSPEAAADLQQIRTYIAQDNPTAAARIATRLVAATDRLERFPHMGAQGMNPARANCRA